MLAVMGLLPWTAKVTADRLAFDGRDLLALSDRQRRQIIGKDMAMIFREPTTSLNPCFTVGFQITESLKTHLGCSRAEPRRQIGRASCWERVCPYVEIWGVAVALNTKTH